MSTSSPELLIELDRTRPRGLRVQIEDALRDAVRSGRVPPGTALPSTRALAADLDVTRGVIVAAYDQLIAEGYLSARAGASTVVNAGPRSEAGRGRVTAADRPDVDFRPGLPDLALFPRAAWSRATRVAMQTIPDADLGYIDPRGLAVVREALADYLGRVRGVCTDAEHVIICNGFAHGLTLVGQALHAAGHDHVAIEDPGHAGLRDALLTVGLRDRAIEVDGSGMVISALRRSRARIAVVTPAHQFPTGAVMSAARRSELVAWAGDVDGYVIEDDYDAEYRYDRQPIGAIQGVQPERVVYSGTLSKSLAPGLRLGWLALPDELVEPIVANRSLTDNATASLAQATFAAFLTHGDLDRHLRRTRRIYRQRRDALVAALAHHLPDATVGGVAAGLHLLVMLPPGLDERTVVARAAAAGVGVYPLDNYRTDHRRPMPPGLVLGYGMLSPARIEHGVRLLAEALGARERPVTRRRRGSLDP